MNDTDTIYTLSMEELRALDNATLNRMIARARGALVLEGPEGLWMFPDQHNGAYITGLPDYCGDLNAAWGLCNGLRFAVGTVYTHGDVWRVWATMGVINIDYENNPSRALVLAWAAWKKEQEA